MKPDGYIAFAIWNDGPELEIDSPVRKTREEAEQDAENRIAELTDNERRFIREYGASPCICDLLTQDEREALVDEIVSANMEQVADMVMDAAERNGIEAGREQLRKCICA